MRIFQSEILEAKTTSQRGDLVRTDNTNVARPLMPLGPTLALFRLQFP